LRDEVVDELCELWLFALLLMALCVSAFVKLFWLDYIKHYDSIMAQVAPATGAVVEDVRAPGIPWPTPGRMLRKLITIRHPARIWATPAAAIAWVAAAGQR
jgi:hypothetical protein